MIKILYAIGSGSVNDNQEFRWSLRSLEKYAHGADGKVNVKPVVVGNAPDWFTGDSIKMDDPYNRKTRNLCAKVMAGCREGLVAGEFMFSADDHFLTRPIDFDLAPQYWKNPMLLGRKELTPRSNNFSMSLVLARETLLAHGMPAMDFSQHFNTYFHADDWQLIERLDKYALALADGDVGANFHSLFANAWLLRNCGKRPLVWRQDRKYPRDTLDIMNAGRADKIAGFSINDNAFAMPGFRRWMDERYAQKSRWEK